MLVGNMALPLMKETVWFDKHRFDDAERVYEERRAGQIQTGSGDAKALNNSPALGSTIAEEIAKTRQRIQNSLKNVSLKTDSEEATSINQRVQQLESVMDKLSNQVTELFSFVQNVTGQLQTVQQFLQSQGMQAQALSLKTPPPAAAQPKAANKADDDDDIDLFGSEDDEEMNAHRAARLKEYETKKAKKGPLVAKSSVVLDVKPWDDETDLKLMEAKVREIKPDGLVWGASKSVPLAFGIHKLQIVAIVEDEKVSIDWLQETIQEIEDLVQSVDIAAFNKL